MKTLKDTIKPKLTRLRAMEQLQLDCYLKGFLDLGAKVGRLARYLDADLTQTIKEWPEQAQNAWFDECEEKLIQLYTDNPHLDPNHNPTKT